MAKRPKGSKPPVTGQSREQYLSNPTRGSYLSPTTIAEIVSLRKSGLSYRQIAERVNRNVDTIMRTLHLPEVERELDEAADQVLAAYRRRLLKIVPEAIAGLEELVQARDRTSIAKLLFGAQVFMPRSEQVMDVALKQDHENRLSEDERLYEALHGHPSDEPCHCKQPKGEKHGN